MKNILNALMIFSVMAGLSSCLKSETMIGPDSPNAVQHIVEFLNPAVINSSVTDEMPVYVMSYDITPSAELEVQVSYSGKGNAPSDIHVKVALDQVAIDSANRQQDKDMTQLPDSVYTINSLDVVIPKGEKIGTIKITLSPDKFDLSEDYALGMKIESISGTDASISGNFGIIVMNIGAKNKYDGVYNYKSGPNQSLNANADENDAELTTTGANTVSTNLVNTYSNIMSYAIDPVTNKATVINSGGIGDPTTDPISNWDPVNKVLHIKWHTSNRQFDETYTYLKKRG